MSTLSINFMTLSEKMKIFCRYQYGGGRSRDKSYVRCFSFLTYFKMFTKKVYPTTNFILFWNSVTSFHDCRLMNFNKHNSKDKKTSNYSNLFNFTKCFEFALIKAIVFFFLKNPPKIKSRFGYFLSSGQKN
jgi:hypothetical protein